MQAGHARCGKHRAGRATAGLAVTGLAGLVLVAGCGSVPATGPGAPVLTSAHQSGPQHGTRAQSAKLAESLLAKNILPRGTSRLPLRPVPPGLRQPGLRIGATSSLDRYRLYRLPMTPRRAIAFLRAHGPAGMKSDGSGQTGQGKRVISRSIGFAPAHLPWGISSLLVGDTVVAAPGRHALLRTDVQVIWFPARSAAEHLAAAHFKKAIMTLRIARPSPRTVRHTFTSAAILRKFVRLLNGLPASPGGVFNCPMILQTYQVILVPHAGQPRVVVSLQGCEDAGITVNGKSQPMLDDSGKVLILVDRLLHVRHVSLHPVAPGDVHHRG